MAAAAHSALEATDMMHYETRAIKEGLKASINRLAAAKGYLPPSLTPDQIKAHGVPQDWSSPRVVVDFHKDDTPGSSDPSFDEMRSVLLQFESSSYPAAGSKERAFYSALRTLLGDITLTRDDKAREMQIVAAHKWFTKHRPRGYSEDPAVFAALAASMSLRGVQQPSRHTASGSDTHGTTFAAQGTKHEFFAIYSKEGAEGAAPPPSSRPTAPDSLASPTGGPLASGVRTSVMPVVMHPSVPCSRSPTLLQQVQAQAQAQQAQQAAAAARAASSRQQALLQPEGRASSRGRVVFGEPDGPQQQRSAAQQPPPPPQQQQPWSSGPFKEPKSKPNSRSNASEAEEMDALRRKWAAVDSKKSQAVVDQQVQQWSLQRARLEEEIIRRQEASRYASPSMQVPGLPVTVGQQSAAQADGYMSPYAHLISDQMGTGNETDTQVPGLMVAPSVTATARDVKAKAQEQHVREVMKISRRLAQLGLAGRVDPELMEHALAPVPDKAYLECLAKLPRPGDLLASKPGSAGTAAKVRGAKRRAASGAAGKK